MDTKRIGNSVELSCISILYDLGCEILLPYGDSQDYDIVIQYKNVFYRVQCKHANPYFNKDGELEYVTIKTCHESGRKLRKKVHYTKESIDFFSTTVNGVCYLIPVEETASRIKTLRFTNTKNGMTTNISYAKDYEAKKILESL